MQSHYCVAVFFVFCQDEKQKTADAKAPAQYKNTADVIKYHQPYKFCIVDCSHYEKARRTNTQHQKNSGIIPGTPIPGPRLDENDSSDCIPLLTFGLLQNRICMAKYKKRSYFSQSLARHVYYIILMYICQQKARQKLI